MFSSVLLDGRPKKTRIRSQVGCAFFQFPGAFAGKTGPGWPGEVRQDAGMAPGRGYLLIFAQESLSVTVRLKTGCSGVESVSGQK